MGKHRTKAKAKLAKRIEDYNETFKRLQGSKRQRSLNKPGSENLKKG